jgi:hypothetical protein
VSALATDTPRPAWTPQADQIIRRCYGCIPNRRIGQALGRTAYQVVGRARALGLVQPVVWTEREIALMRRHYRGGDSAALTALVALTGKQRHQVRQQARRLGLARTKERRWTKDDDYGLSIMWGRRSDKAVAKKLGRTIAACKIRATRVLHRSRKDGVQGWTGRGLARLMGVDEHKVTRQWLANGWMTARATPIRAGANKTLLIEEPALIAFLTHYPHEYDRARMHDPSGYYRKIAEAAWNDDPIYRQTEAAAKLGVHPQTLERFRREGRIGGILAHDQGGAALGVWKYRQSDLDSYRPRQRLAPVRTIRSAALLAEGIAWVRPIRTWPAAEDRYGPRRAGEAQRAAGIAWWRTWTPAGYGKGQAS